jgi:predicted metal-dependent peptidase
MQTQEILSEQILSEQILSEQTSGTRMAAATLRLCCDRPYLSAALWAMERLERPGLGTLAVDRRWRLYYDPEAVLDWSVEELAGVLYHEVCHLLCDHAGRAAMAEDPFLWNVAADAEINDGLREEKVLLPDRPIYPDALGLPNGLLAEEYYAHIAQRGHVPAACSGPAGGRCGSCVSGVPDAWEESETALGSAGLNAAEAELVRYQVALAVRNAGSVPGYLQRWAEERLDPQVDWRWELAAHIRGALNAVSGVCDYTYARPSRRQGCAGMVVLPSLRRPLPNVAVIVDTSGSMTDRMLSSALSEISGILQAAGQRDGVTVLSVDSAVHACGRVFQPDQVRLLGGGGTDMGAGLAAAARLAPRPDVAIVLTDGFTPWPERCPGRMRTVVALTNPAGKTPDWSKTILLKERSIPNAR